MTVSSMFRLTKVIKRIATVLLFIFVLLWFGIMGSDKKKEKDHSSSSSPQLTFVQGNDTAVPPGYEPCLNASTGVYNPLASMKVADTGSGNVNSGRFGNTRNNGSKFHGGIDLAAEPGTPAYAVAGGRVVKVVNTAEDGEAYENVGGGYGNYVVVESVVDGKTVQMYYAHLSDVNVSPGQVIQAGSAIATTGRTGNAWNVPNAHLHFEVREGGSSVNPEPYLNGGVSSSGDFVDVVCDNRKAAPAANDYAIPLTPNF